MMKNKTNDVPEEKVQEIFDSIAVNYDKVNSIISLGTHNKWRHFGTKQINTNARMVLDLCCGTGDWTVDIKRHVGEDTKVVAVDFSKNMLEIAKEKIRNHHFSTAVEIIQADAMNLPFADNTFDDVTIGFGLRNVPDANTALKEIYRVLRPGGKIICLDAFKVETPLIKTGWKIYFGKFMPMVGQAFNKENSEYEYLNSSVNKFVSPNELEKMFQANGFKQTSFKKFIFGSAAIHLGIK